jgi:hypothetical protein
MKEWMKRLAEHQKMMRQSYPEDTLAVIFDIDDTIFDLRHMILHVLRSFDRHHGTGYFVHLGLADVGVTEAGISRIMDVAGIPRPERSRALDWCREYSWSSSVVAGVHRPFPGVMEVIRCLQEQPRTVVAINTGRPEALRYDTLRCLGRTGRPHGVTFADHLLFMSSYPWGVKIAESKVEGMDYFRDRGYRIAAFIDNEPENLKAVADHDRSGEILMLHADTVFSSDRKTMPANAISGSIYDPMALAGIDPWDDQLGKAA